MTIKGPYGSQAARPWVGGYVLVVFWGHVGVPNFPAPHGCRGWTLAVSAASAKLMTADPPFGRYPNGTCSSRRPWDLGYRQINEGLLIGDWSYLNVVLSLK